ncbi:hypothetical protein SISSUDRAFT_1062242 [Sistotremastrum suecicum HHB10207 ss-3]|uniref:F-box domain-containing protein n=1 Tax=Sistotremastrum suecicum HHB10207 ss-3 TaxID=1314776 RepID=A0A166D4D0_9AGAM|nr:hypothetical protein SISSUDRAFT_1062242 [Sistotremastrum suecicum HHB10207 ss-3]
MASMFSRVPIEIVQHILSGACLDQLTAIAQTSARFYSLAKSDRILWTSCTDHYKLPLPTGHTVHTVPVESLFRLALRACSIERALEQPMVEPKRWAILPPSEDDRLPDNVLVPGGGWTLYYTAEEMRFHDMRKAPIDDGVLVKSIGEPKYFHVVSDILGEGNVRCVQRISAPDKQAGEDIARILDIRFPDSADTSNDTPSPYLLSEPVSFIGIHRLEDVRGPLILAVRRDPDADTVLVINSQTLAGSAITIEGFEEEWFDIESARFHPSLRKIVLEITTVRESDHELMSAIWLLEIPDSVPSQQLGEPMGLYQTITWTESRAKPTHQFTLPFEWSADITERKEVPPNFVPIHEFVIHMDREIGYTYVFVSLCLSTEGSLVPLPLGTVDGPWLFSRDKGKAIGMQWFSEELVDIVYSGLSGRKMTQVTFKLPEDKQFRGPGAFRHFSPSYGQLFLEKEPEGQYDDWPCFFVQY